MMTVNGKAYSDAEVDSVLTQMDLDLKQWREKVAKEFFSKKNTRKTYKVDFYMPYIESSVDMLLSENDVAKYQAFQDMCMEEFLEEYGEEALDGNGKINESLWKDYLSDCYSEAGFTETVLDGPDRDQEVDVLSVDLEHPANVYRFLTIYYDSEMQEMQKRPCFINMKDDEYISLLTEFIEDPNLTSLQVFYRHPELLKKVASNTRLYINECAAFPVEIREDAMKILSDVGQEKPSDNLIEVLSRMCGE